MISYPPHEEAREKLVRKVLDKRQGEWTREAQDTPLALPLDTTTLASVRGPLAGGQLEDPWSQELLLYLRATVKY